MKSGFIGLGDIGRGIARALAASGREVIVHDLQPEGPAELAAMGARVASSPAEVARGSEALGICVRTDEQALAVVTDLLDGASPGLLVCLHSTVHAATLRQAAALCEARGVRLVDATVTRSGGGDGKTITYMLGGSAQDVADARIFVEPSAKAIVEAGPLGAATTLKIANNLATYIQFVAGHEALTLARRSGVDPSLLMEVMTSNGVATPAIRGLMRVVMGPKPMDPAQRESLKRTLDIAWKDLDCVLEAAAELHLALPGAQLAREQMEAVILGEG